VHTADNQIGISLVFGGQAAWAVIGELGFFLLLADTIVRLKAKNVTILGLPRRSPGLHIVCPKDSQRYYLLFTRIHRLFAPLFTSIRTLLKTQPLPHRHDST
jgi:hypothetical protein